MPELRDRTAAFTLAVIADSADRRTGWTFDFSMREIARFARLSLRGARDRVRYLEANAYVKTKIKGKAGRERLQFRVLFDFTGRRRPEVELYPPAERAGVGKRPPAPAAAAPAPAAAPPAGKRTPPDPLIGDPSSSVSVRKSDQKIAMPRPKKIPPAAESERERIERIEEAKRRTAEAMRARGVTV